MIKILSVRGSIGGGEKPFRNFSEIKQESELSDKEETYYISGRIGFIRNEPEQIFKKPAKIVKNVRKRLFETQMGFIGANSAQKALRTVSLSIF